MSCLKITDMYFLRHRKTGNNYKDKVNEMNTEKTDTKKKEAGAQLAYAALDEVPTPKSDAKEIVGLVKSSGRISGYQLSDGSTVSKEEGVSMAKAGEIQGVGIAHRKDNEYLNFGGLLGYGPIMPISKLKPNVFIDRGGQIPSPLNSLKN